MIMSRIYLNPEHSHAGQLYVRIPNPDSPGETIEYGLATLRLGTETLKQSSGGTTTTTTGVYLDIGTGSTTYTRFTEIDTPDITAISSGYFLTQMVIYKDPACKSTHYIYTYSGGFDGRRLRIDTSEKKMTTGDVITPKDSFFFRREGVLDKDDLVSSFADIGYNQPFHIQTAVGYSSTDFGSFGVLSINKTEGGEWGKIGLRAGDPHTFILRPLGRDSGGTPNIFVGTP
jgi:hypothetical protein